MKESKKNIRGITLIALVITIIVLLILAGVSISMLVGQNGILTKVKEANDETVIAKEKENIQLAYSQAKADKLQNGDISNITALELKSQLDVNEVKNVIVDGNIKVTYTETKNIYTIDKNGVISKLGEEENEEAGLYHTDGSFIPWENLKEDGIIHVNEGNLSTNVNLETGINGSSEQLNGKLVISNEVDSLDTYAFALCNNLTEIVMPNSVTNIGILAFGVCINLTEIEIPDSVITIEEEAFFLCTSLKNVSIGNGITAVGTDVFEDCTEITTVTLGNIISNMKLVDIFPDSNKISKVIIKEGVTNIIAQACLDNENLTDLIIQNGLISIGQGAFFSCTNLENVTMPSSLINIEGGAFNNCTNLKNIVIPNKVENIGQNAFSQCKKITEIVIPDSVENIGDYAFSGCEKITEIVIPNSVVNIGVNAFVGTNISKIVVNQGNTIYDSRNDCNAIIESETNTLIYGCGNTTIPNTVTTIGEYAFYYCENLMEISIPDSVIDIKSDAFLKCSKLRNITLSKNIEKIDSYVFDGCVSLAEIVIPNKVTEIGPRAFADCTSLKEIIIPTSVTCIRNVAFIGCTGLNSVTFENTVGWHNNYDTAIDVTDPKTNVEIFVKDYLKNYYR